MEKIISRYIPMTESAFYILLSLIEPRHGYGIIQDVSKMTSGRVVLGAGTLYGTISKMEKDGLIHFIADEDKRKLYQITTEGKTILNIEKKRLKELYQNVKAVDLI